MRNRDLLDRIWEAVPVTQPAFARLLGLLDVEVSDEVDTAAVTGGARSRLLLNPGFIASHCRTRERLAMLVMHELSHVLFGHTRLFPRVTRAQNWAFDAVINAHLCRQFPKPEWTALFRGLYSAERFPEALLRPPEDWTSEQPRWRLRGERGRVHQALYSDVSVTYGELFELLETVLVTVGDDGLPGLLGTHDEPAPQLDPDTVREVRDLVARWPMDRPVSGRDQGGELERYNVARAEARREAVAVVRRALWPLLDRGNDARNPHRDLGPVPAVLAYRSGPDRQATVREACGETPLFHRGVAQAVTLARAGRAHVYLDVSGSMSEALPLIVAALRPLRPWLHERVHLFSTEVVDVGLAALAHGDVITNYGTDIACVSAHLLAKRVNRAVILTDGWVGSVPAEDARTLHRRGARIHGVVTHEGSATYQEALPGHAWRLPSLRH